MLRNYSRPIAIAKYCGAVSSLASTWESHWERLLAGESHFQLGDSICQDWPKVSEVSMVGEFGGWIQQPEYLDRLAKLANDLGSQVKEQLKELLHRDTTCRAALLIASSHGNPSPITSIVNHAKSKSAAPTAAWQGILQEDIAHVVSAALEVRLPVYAISGACASSIVGASYASDMVSMGVYDIVVVVGIDSLSRIAASGFYNIGAATKSSGTKPYDISRDGTTVGEGAVLFILCREGVLRCDEVQAHVSGTSVFCDAEHLVEPDPHGVARVLNDAINQAGIAQNDICGIYWHGTGTKQNDKTESQVASIIFGEKSPPCTSTKGSLGHTMGASGGFNLLAACKTLTTGLMPHVCSLVSPEYPNLDVVYGKNRKIKKGPILITALGFGGVNAAAVITPIGWSATL